MIRLILTAATAVLLNACGSESNPEKSAVSVSDGSKSKIPAPVSMPTTAEARQKILEECAKESPRGLQVKEFADCVRDVPFDGDLRIPSS